MKIDFKIYYIWLFLPVPIFYAKKRMGKFVGKAYGIFAVIWAKYRDDGKLHAHELIHIKQFYRTFGLHAILYNLSRKYRLECEREAYGKKGSGFSDAKIQYHLKDY